MTGEAIFPRSHVRIPMRHLLATVGVSRYPTEDMKGAARRLCLGLGVAMLLGGVAHTIGVGHLYVTKGWPDLNRILLDVWIAEAQLAGGFLFIKASRSDDPRPWSVGAAAIVWSYTIPFLPVLVHRAPVVFWVAPTLYSLVSAWLLVTIRWPRSTTAGT